MKQDLFSNTLGTGQAKPKLNGQPLDQVNFYNYLGVSIDGKLDFGKFLREK